MLETRLGASSHIAHQGPGETKLECLHSQGKRPPNSPSSSSSSSLKANALPVAKHNQCGQDGEQQLRGERVVVLSGGKDTQSARPSAHPAPHSRPRALEGLDPPTWAQLDAKGLVRIVILRDRLEDWHVRKGHEIDVQVDGAEEQEKHRRVI